MAKYRRRPPILDHFGQNGTRRLVPVPFGTAATTPPSKRPTVELDWPTRPTRESLQVITAMGAGRDATPTEEVAPLPAPVRRVSLSERFYNVAGFHLDQALVAAAVAVMILLAGVAVDQIISQFRR